MTNTSLYPLRGLLVAQFCGAFNDNAWKFMVALLGIREVASVLSTGQDMEPDAQKRVRIYDTTLPGYSNAGHLWGDDLTAAQRAQLLEYLKTL